MKIFINFLVFTILLSVVFVSCKKDEADDIPVISFVKPVENQTFTVGDTVEIVFDVTSVSNIKSVQISIVDYSLKPVTKLISYDLLNGKTLGRVETAIIIDDLFLTSGNYKVFAQVYNEKDQKDKYQNIVVNALDKELQALAVITKQPNTVEIWNYNSSFQSSLIGTMIGDYGGSAYMPFHNRMVLSGKVKGSFTIWDYFQEDTVLHIQASSNPPFPYFTGVAIVDHYVVAQYYAEKFEQYAYNGKLAKTINYSNGYYPEYVFDVGENFISIELNKSGLQRRLLTHLKSTGYIYSYYTLQGPVVAAFPFENNDFMMFSNYNSSGQIELFKWNDNATTKPISYSGDEFIDVVQINKNEYLILTSQEVLWYRYSVSSIAPIIQLSVSDPIKIRYDAISKRIYVVDKQGFKIYSYPSGSLIHDQRINKNVLNLHLIYNR